MENRDRDELSQGEGPTEAGDINRETSQKKSIENGSEESSSRRDRIEITRRTGSSDGWH